MSNANQGVEQLETGKMRKMMQYCIVAGMVLGIGGGAAGLGMGAVVVWQVLLGDDTALRKTTILAKIKEETTLFYLDEETRIGSFFESNHRRYIPIDEVPPHVNNAIIAAEDKNFYQHVGIDPIALIKAVGEGVLRGGRFRRGGSTITQQTVKNIMDDWEASFSRKFREMIKALQLERLYTKRQILEFYLNQFHVAGNGNGIGIAAKYYFNKDVRDLSLVEGAFIAGSVKGPGKYNPFIKYTKKTRERAKKFANTRKNYVLGRMLGHEWISQEEYDEAVTLDVPFNRGEFRTAEVALVDLVRTQLKNKEVLEALNLKSINDLNVAGMRVFTTLDSKMQKSAQLAMRRNLSRIDTILLGFSPEKKEKFKPLRTLKVNEFYYGKVEAVLGNKPENTEIKLSFGLPSGVIPASSILRYGKLLDLPVGHARGWKYHIEQLRKKLKVGDILFVEVIEYDPDTNEAILEFKKRPKISGGLIAIDKGEVRAVVSGFDTLGFNRAMHAKKPPGSVFKSVVFFGAMQLGWSILDRINNSRQVFPFQGQFYYPRGDHASPYREVSMLWAGIMSENLSSVALTARLVEKLTFEQFRELMNFMGYLPKIGESTRDYHYRVSKATGISVDNKGIEEYQLTNAINDIAPDLVFAGSQKLLTFLRQMWLGDGYLAEFANLNNYDRQKYSVRELNLRRNLIKNNFRRTQKLSEALEADWSSIQQLFESEDARNAFSNPASQHLFERFRVLPSSGNRPELGYFYEFDGEDYPDSLSHSEKNLLSRRSGRKLNMLDAQAVWGRSGLFASAGAANIALTDVKLSGRVPMGVFTQIGQYLRQRYDNIVGSGEEYDLPRYFQHHDFRIALGLKYLVKLSREMGVYNRLEPILSFPLGTNDVTVGEVAKLYQTFIAGETYKFFEKGPNNQLTFIRRIEDRLGNVLYELDRKPHQLAKPKYADQMREILRKIITHGTGKRARGELHVSLHPNGTASRVSGTHKGAKAIPKEDESIEIRIPAFGKTGTTNDYTTSYFAGFIPYPTKKSNSIDPANSYVLASYVGYDNNKTMRRGRYKVYGSSGALPVWIDLAKEIIKIQKYDEKIDGLDLKVISRKLWPLKFKRENRPLMIDLPRGLVIRSGRNADYDLWGTTNLAVTGESFVNQFALGSSVKSIVRIPQDTSGGSWQPFKSFSLFRTRKNAEELAAMQTSGGDGETTGLDALSKIVSDPQSRNSSIRVYDNMGNRISRPGATKEDPDKEGNTRTRKETKEDPTPLRFALPGDRSDSESEAGQPYQPQIDKEFEGETFEPDDDEPPADEGDLW